MKKLVGNLSSPRSPNFEGLWEAGVKSFKRHFKRTVVLTPGHFLIGRPLQSLPEPDMTDKLDNRLSQWQKLKKFVQFIWRKWRLDYLNNLQARHKWQFEKENVTPNSMVILKDENLPPCKWTMGRILEVVKGSDGKLRVVKVKTPQRIFKRGISKICLLPSV
ncbi:integrase catalytic domain-containing protein [Trichonephila clavipes]|nr:integrase catalytic domain-containing protein [Trichonephila clavipes]